MARNRKSVARLLIKAPVYLVAAWLLGFGFFVLTLPKAIPDGMTPKSDGIIVLTGGAGRLEAGLKLLEAKVADRMLISGVNPVVEPHELSALTGAEEALFTCCVDLDRAAPNTAGNATESNLWTQTHGYQTLVLVTADYHMPRSLILFRRAMPNATIFAYPVKGEWPMLYLANEYNKYVFTLIGEAFKPAPGDAGKQAKSATGTL
ncbi:YdcF family protein [Kordiimonas lipolytica]|uniref:YdcF family protein n=1 Tax=Kordiimonas lipolytica TaxID=1662421 RepID=A0ABV8UCG4_9PROT|nr:YdcF family protein [Kordiimonas lipolytica]